LSTVLVQEQIQLKASQILRQTKVQQFRGHLYHHGRYCAMGAILNHFGWDGKNFIMPLDKYDTKFVELVPNQKDRNTIIMLNDTGATFSDIADWLEERGL